MTPSRPNSTRRETHSNIASTPTLFGKSLLLEALLVGLVVMKKFFLLLTRCTYVYLEPGGIIDASAERSSFCLFSAPDDPEVIKKHVKVFNKLIRRYKYLQKSLDDTLKHVLQFINKWKSEECNKLAMATGYMITTQLTGISVLKVLLKDYLVKDGMYSIHSL